MNVTPQVVAGAVLNQAKKSRPSSKQYRERKSLREQTNKTVVAAIAQSGGSVSQKSSRKEKHHHTADNFV